MKSLFHRSWKTQMKQVNQDLPRQCGGGEPPCWQHHSQSLPRHQTTTTVSTRPLGATQQVSAEPQRRPASTSTLPGILLHQESGTLFWPMSAVSVLDIWGHIVSILATLGWVFCTFSPSAFWTWMVRRPHHFARFGAYGINASPQLDVH